MYSNSEKVDMLGKYDRNARRAANMYATKYPKRRHPCPKMFYNIEKCARVRDWNKIIFDINVPVD